MPDFTDLEAFPAFYSLPSAASRARRSAARAVSAGTTGLSPAAAASSSSASAASPWASASSSSPSAASSSASSASDSDVGTGTSTNVGSSTITSASTTAETTAATTTTTTTTRPKKPKRKPWCLLAQVKENMTITQPTLIVTDRQGIDFALLFEDRDINLRPFKKGYTIAVPRAYRTDREGEFVAGTGGGAQQGKKSIVRVEKGKGVKVRVISGRLAHVLELGKLLNSDVLGKRCGYCRAEPGGEGGGEGETTTLSRCLGCGIAVYCSKECQANSWQQLDHKANCKVLRTIKALWG